MQFAAREGLRKERLFFWKRRLRQSAALTVAGVSFAKVEVATADRESAVSALEVRTQKGHMVRVGPGFDETTLRRLLSVLGGA